MASDLDVLRERLEAISEELGDIALTRLREAIDAGATRRPADERRVTRARTAVDRAVAILRTADEAE